MTLTLDDRVFLARWLRRSADYHATRQTKVTVSHTTLASVHATLGMGAVTAAPLYSLTPAEARAYADALDGQQEAA